MSEEKRRALRYNANLFVDLQSTTLKDRVGRGVVVDVSHTGFAIETESELSLGDEYDCHIEIPFSLRAKVVRRLQPGKIKRYGMQIHGQNFLDRLILRRVLKGSKITRKV